MIDPGFARSTRLLLTRLMVGLAALAVLSATPVVAWSQDAPSQASDPVSGKVDVRVRVVLANHAKDVDAELRSLMKQLTFTRFTGFKLLETYPASLAVGGDATFSLVGDRKLKVDLIERDAARAKIRIRLFGPDKDKVLDTTVSIPRNKSFVIGGPKLPDGALVLPVTVSY
ncbi:MAG: hypothetical protein ACI8PZ_005459 [Myxococcota bacterium]